MSPKVFILIPAFNYAPYLDECIQSGLRQIYSDFELIEASNNSTDNREEVVARFQKVWLVGCNRIEFGEVEQDWTVPYHSNTTKMEKNNLRAAD